MTFPEYRDAISKAVEAAESGRPGELRKSIRLFWESLPKSLLFDVTDSRAPYYLKEARTAVERLSYRRRQACISVMKSMGEWR
jgi:hypothetical protein